MFECLKCKVILHFTFVSFSTYHNKYIFECFTLNLFSYFLSAVAKLDFLKVALEQNSVMGAPTTGGDGGVKIPSWLPSLYGG